LKKGTQVYIEGKLQTRQWNDKDGNKRNITEIVAESFNILQRRDAGTNPNTNEGGNDTSFDKQDSGDLPF
ncbi:MAG TPA: single-stranded DNA-binding protein, partial [Bacteroidia bacterium]|nr:single-stranded DNA-binding protein [Bacteroidia bacterium]